jgi:hypothetical protein
MADRYSCAVHGILQILNIIIIESRHQQIIAMLVTKLNLFQGTRASKHHKQQF